MHLPALSTCRSMGTWDEVKHILFSALRFLKFSFHSFLQNKSSEIPFCFRRCSLAKAAWAETPVPLGGLGD